jgi:hypothetical protein
VSHFCAIDRKGSLFGERVKDMSDILQAIERKAEELNFSKALFINSGSGIPFSQSRDYYFPEGIIGTRGNFPPFYM